MNSSIACSVIRKGFLLALVLVAMSSPSAVWAHAEHGSGGGFASGLGHPIGGLDHIIAMVAVGLWGAYLGSPALWLLPVVFPLVMALGGALGIMGVPVPMVETGIAGSAIALGMMVALAARPPLWVAAVLVGFFAIFHGHAHGAELPEAANAVAYAIGFVISTGLLHLAGIGFGLLTRYEWGQLTVRTAGAVIAITGACILFGLL